MADLTTLLSKFLTALYAGSVPATVQSVAPSSSGSQGAGPMGFGITVLTATPSGPGYSVTLPNATGSGAFCVAICRSAFFVVIYPQSGQQISNYGANTGYAIYPITTLVFYDSGAGQWDFLSNLPFLYPIYRNFTAHAGGGQASATPLGYGTMWIATCATAGDSVLLPSSTGGLETVWIYNAGAASCDVFPQSGTAINKLAANAAIAIPAGTSLLFLDIGPPNQWVTR